MRRVRKPYKNLVGKPEKKKRLEKPRRRQDDIIKMNIKEVGYEYFDGIHLDRDRGRVGVLVNAITRLRVLYKVGNFLTAERLLASQEGLSSMEFVTYLLTYLAR
jgi:hypothetical protein